MGWDVMSTKELKCQFCGGTTKEEFRMDDWNRTETNYFFCCNMYKNYVQNPSIYNIDVINSRLDSQKSLLNQCEKKDYTEQDCNILKARNMLKEKNMTNLVDRYYFKRKKKITKTDCYQYLIDNNLIKDDLASVKKMYRGIDIDVVFDNVYPFTVEEYQFLRTYCNKMLKVELIEKYKQDIEELKERIQYCIENGYC